MQNLRRARTDGFVYWTKSNLERNNSLHILLPPGHNVHFVQNREWDGNKEKRKMKKKSTQVGAKVCKSLRIYLHHLYSVTPRRNMATVHYYYPKWCNPSVSLSCLGWFWISQTNEHIYVKIRRFFFCLFYLIRTSNRNNYYLAASFSIKVCMKNVTINFSRKRWTLCFPLKIGDNFFLMNRTLLT